MLTTKYYLEGNIIIIISSHKDLGVLIGTKLRFHPHGGQTVSKAGGVTSSLLKSTVCRSPMLNEATIYF